MSAAGHSSPLVGRLLDVAGGAGAKTVLVVGETDAGGGYWVGTRYPPVATLFEAALRCLLAGPYRRVVAFTGSGYRHLPNWQIGPSFPLGSEAMIWVVRGETKRRPAEKAAGRQPWELDPEELLTHTTAEIDRLIWRAGDRVYWDRLEEFIKQRDAEARRDDGARTALVVDYNFVVPTPQEMTQKSTTKFTALRDRRVDPRLHDLVRSRFGRDLAGSAVDMVLVSEDRTALELLREKKDGETSVLAQLFQKNMEEGEWNLYRRGLESDVPHLYLGPDAEVVHAARARHPGAGSLLKWPEGAGAATLYEALRGATVDHAAKPEPRRRADGGARELTGEEVEHFAATLRGRIVGQSAAVKTVVGGFESLAAGTRKNARAPMNFLMVGPTGTGKTEIAKLTAETLNLPLYRINMPDWKGTEGIWNLLGSPQGYHGGEGRLTSYVRDHPTAVLLFDEVEKADPEMFDPLLSLIDEGRLDDRRTGQIIDFSKTVIFFTSNLLEHVPPETAGDQNALREQVFSTRYLRREFVGRIQQIVPFFHFSPEEVEVICRKQLQSYLDAVAANRADHPAVVIQEGVFASLASHVDPNFGARNVGSIIEQRVTEKLTRALLAHRGEARLIRLLAAEGDLEVQVE